MIRVIFFLIPIVVAIVAALMFRSFLKRRRGQNSPAKPPANENAGASTNWWEDYSENFVNDVKSKPAPHYLAGTCEICGKTFSPETSTPTNYLREINFEFYGKKRDKLVCSKCLANLRKDKGVSID